MSYQRPKPGAVAESQAPLVPPLVYRVLCTAVDNTPSKTTGAPMTTCHVQILSPDQVPNANGTVSRTAGIEGDLRFVFSEKNLVNCFEALYKLNVPLPAAASSQSEDIALTQKAISEYLTNMTFEMTVRSQKEPMNGPDGKPLCDSLGRQVQGRERADFAMFNIIGIPKPISELGAGTTPSPY